MTGLPGAPARAMTEDELLEGITQAMTLVGWRWTHIRRSDTITMGMSGLPDIIAGDVTRKIVVAWELKSQTGAVSGEQWGWLNVLRVAPGVDARVIRPSDYDAALSVIIGGKDPAEAFAS